MTFNNQSPEQPAEPRGLFVSLKSLKVLRSVAAWGKQSWLCLREEEVHCTRVNLAPSSEWFCMPQGGKRGMEGEEAWCPTLGGGSPQRGHYVTEEPWKGGQGAKGLPRSAEWRSSVLIC